MSKPLILPFVILTAAFGAPPESQKQPPPVPQPNRWEKEIQAFEAWDRKNSFAENAVLFIGSSSIRLWNTRTYFPKRAVINRGFGGAHVADVNRFAGRIVIPYKPKVIVFFAGGNDIAAGKTPQGVSDDIRQFIRHVRVKLADTPIIFLAVKPSPQRMTYWPKIRAVNSVLAELCAHDATLWLVDTATPLLDHEGNPIPSLYQKDGLHLSETGYRIWTMLLTPVLERCMEATSPQQTGPVAVARAQRGYVASKSSKIFHTTSCPFAQRISDANRVELASRDAALRTGRRPCKTCNP